MRFRRGSPFGISKISLPFPYAAFMRMGSVRELTAGLHLQTFPQFGLIVFLAQRRVIVLAPASRP